MRRHLRCARLIVSVTGMACAPAPRLLQPAPTRAWPATLVAARDAADSGRYGEADRALRDFAVRYPGAPEARETHYWRALYKLDPANRDASVREAVAFLDDYLLSPSDPARRADATVLRRVAERVGQLEQRVAATRTAAVTDPRDEELRQVREQLQKSQAELDRIKRRLAAPRP